MTPDPRLVEREIARIREREAGTPGPAARAALWNLLVLREAAPREPGSDPVEEAVRHLAGRRAGRIVVVVPEAAEKSEAFVSGRCAAGPSAGSTVCLEEVEIRAGTDGVGADPGTWSPLLRRGLPVYAWLTDGAPADRPGRWEAALAATGLADAVLLDSSRACAAAPSGVPAPLAAASRLARTVRSPVLDFSWRRVRVLREQAARAFDPPPRRALLPAVTAVLLSGGSPAEAALFFRWLAARLPHAPRFDHGDRGPLADGFSLRFSVEGAPDVEVSCTGDGCLTCAGTPGGCLIPSDGEILLSMLDMPEPDPAYRQAIREGGPR